MIPICIDDVSPQAAGLQKNWGNGRVYAPLLPDYKWPWTGGRACYERRGKVPSGENFWTRRLPLENAYVHITDNGQENIALCCDFLAYRLSVGLESVHGKKLLRNVAEILKCHNISWLLNMFDSIWCYYYSLTGEETQIPVLSGEHKLSTGNSLCKSADLGWN